MRRRIIAISACLVLSLGSLFFLRVPLSLASEINNIVIYGDTRTNNEVHREVTNAIIKVNPKVVFHSGDMVNNGDDPREWEVFNSITKVLRSRAEFYTALGNHENNSRLYFANFRLPNNGRWYSLERQGIHFIILDTGSEMVPGSEQYRWLEDELSKVSKDAGFKIVICHIPFFSVTERGGDYRLRNDLLPLFEKYGVDAVFSGHEHSYQRFLYQGTYFIVSAGGGAPLYSQSRNSPYLEKFIKDYHFCVLTTTVEGLSVVVYDRNLSPVDRFNIKR